ncbi:hypothetical protein [uncultured Aquimarina sp.]|uniref:hypothetical protein n=1 Tax=uncultured Aquimarina sp. TaxID=575652 RepID=UPI002619EF9B|nr:hypothetical protein [uncultured Aquimarina sp.]
MKTIQVCIGLFMLAVVPFGCSDDDLEIEVIEEIANGETVLELQFEDYALGVEEIGLNQRKEELLIILENDPQNDNALGELEIVNNRLSFIEERGGMIEARLVGFGLGPIPPLPPCFDPGPDNNCPILLNVVNKILIEQNLNGFGFQIVDPQSEEVLFALEEFEASELNENLLQSPFNTEGIQLPEEFLVVVKKFEGEMDLSYNFYGTL